MSRKDKILEFITCYIQEHGYSPTYDEIGEGVGLKARSSVHTHIKKMFELGILETDTDGWVTRAIRVPGYEFIKADDKDLISRQAVYDMLHGLGGCDATDEWSKGWDKAIDTAINGLEDIPTVYDVDKVVERLEFELETNTYYSKVYDMGIKDAISIVKGAVKDERSEGV